MQTLKFFIISDRLLQGSRIMISCSKL